MTIDNDEVAVERLAWHLFTEKLDMGHEPTRVMARREWANARAQARFRARLIARQYLRAAVSGELPPAPPHILGGGDPE